MRRRFSRSLSETHRHLALEWHPERNGDLTPEQVTAGSNRRVWWRCRKGPDHQWATSVANRALKGSGCPFCSGRAASASRSLAAERPALAAQWHPTRNGDLTPADVPCGSPRKVWWRCEKGPDHEWASRVCNRSKGIGCPFCSNKRISVTNSLATLHPDLAAQWHPRKNGWLSPHDIIAGSATRVWWQCPKDPEHQWQTTAYNRTLLRRGCPFCAGKRVVSSRRLAVAAPGLAECWHPDKNGEMRFADAVTGTKARYWWRCPNDPSHAFRAQVDAQGRRAGDCPWCARAADRPAGRAARASGGERGPRTPSHSVPLGQSLASTHLELAAQWHPTRNGDLSPTDVASGTARKVWWQCDKASDHFWLAPVGRRASRRDGCPFCRGVKVTHSNCLETVMPEIAAQWHPTRNGDLTPRDVVPGANRVIWWRCPQGPDHEWKAALANRTRRGDGCPFCRGIRASVTNSIAARHPELAAQWHPTLNGDLTPDHVPDGSAMKVWWQCPEGPDHQWHAQVYSRARAGMGCPFCAGHQASVTNCIAATHPRVARLWHPHKNADLTPGQVTRGSGKLVWWACPAGPDHQWEATVKQEVASGARCPFCTGRRVSVTNCLQSLFPAVAREWHPERNGALTPRDVLAASPAQAAWLCALSHQWTDSVRARTLKGKGCPICVGA